MVLLERKEEELNRKAFLEILRTWQTKWCPQAFLFVSAMLIAARDTRKQVKGLVCKETVGG